MLRRSVSVVSMARIMACQSPTIPTLRLARVGIVGDWPALIRAIETTDTERRNTLLAVRITQTETS